MTIVRYTADEAKKLKGDTDIDRFNSLTDKQIEEAARNDPDSAVPTPEQLKQFTRKKVHGKKDNQQRTSKKPGGRH